MGYLVDTNAISALAPGRPPSSELLVARAWLRQHHGQLFLSTITIAEIQAGIVRLERREASRRAAELEGWLNAVLKIYRRRILPVTIPVAIETGRLMDRAIARGETSGFEDACIAATASMHDLAIVTRNARHFQAFGIPYFWPQ